MNPITYFALLFTSATWLWPNASTQMANNPKPVVECPSHYDTSVKMDVYTNVEMKAEYPGGEAPWGRYVNRNFRQENAGDVKDCTVKIKLVITEAGEIRKVVALHGDTEVKEPSDLEKEVIRIYKKSGRWSPGVCGGRKVTSELIQTLSPCSVAQ
jgi:protein TonB